MFQVQLKTAKPASHFKPCFRLFFFWKTRQNICHSIFKDLEMHFLYDFAKRIFIWLFSNLLVMLLGDKVCVFYSSSHLAYGLITATRAVSRQFIPETSANRWEHSFMSFITKGYFSSASLWFLITLLTYSTPNQSCEIYTLWQKFRGNPCCCSTSPVEDSAYLLEELGVEKISMAGVVIMLPAAVDTGEAAVVKEVWGFLASSFRRCSCWENELV